MITITDSAQEKIKEILAEEGDKHKLRMFIQGGGCSGFMYEFMLDEEQNEDDFEIIAGEVVVLVDSMSIQYLQGAIVDFKDDLDGSRFSIKNPQATTQCGCGSSFSI